MPVDNEITHLAPGTLLCKGKYKITRFIGAGGFGCTYEAEFVPMRTRVAVKEFFVHTYCNRNKKGIVSVGTKNQTDMVENLKEKFKREARNLFMLQHPRIVRVTDILEENGTAYYVMDFIDGLSLHDIIKRCGPLPEPTALKYIRQVMDALEYVHSKKMLHLDIKPANIMVDRRDNATLIDFGVSKIYDGINGQNDSTVTCHTPGFAPPEQAGNSLKSFSPATDIYSLGATLYCTLTGQTPPNSAVLISDETALESLPEYISPDTRRAVYTMMQPTIMLRPDSIQAVRNLLDGTEPLGDDIVGDQTMTHPAHLNINGSQNAEKPNTTTPHRTEPLPSNLVEQLLNESAPTPTPQKDPVRMWIWIAASVLVAIATTIILIAILHGKSQKSTPIQTDSIPIDLPEAVIPTTGIVDGYQWVDMGTDAKWAAYNIGASSESDCGQYFAWGETNTKASYSFGKYQLKGKVPSDITGDDSYDPARTLWGGNWRMPTRADFQELIDICDWEWDSKGAKVTAPNGNSIYLPAAGFYDGSALIDNGDIGGYWSSTLSDDPKKAWRIHFHKDKQDIRKGDCYYGRSVRPVINL